MNDPFVLFEIAKWSPELHRMFCKWSKPYRRLLQTTEMKYQIMDAWAGNKGYYTNEKGWTIRHGLCTMEQVGIYEFFRNGERHRGDDKPQCVTRFSMIWFVNDLRHRENDKPAVIHKNGSMSWWKEGKLHRENDLPAIHLVPTSSENDDLYQAWALNDVIYKEAGNKGISKSLESDGYIKKREDCVYLGGQEALVQIPQKDVDCLLSATAYRDAHPRGL